MKSKLSILTVFFCLTVYILTSFLKFSDQKEIKVTTWDALGYYIYLPAIFIYDDLQNLAFYPEIEKQYKLQGKDNEFYQFRRIENGHYAGKYFVGIAVMQAPFFALSHLFANASSYQPDGFSQPYQIGILFGALIYFFLGLLLLRKVLLAYFKESTVSITLVFLCLATNLIQYVSIDVGQSHIYLFFLYSLMLWLTVQWHKNYDKKYALLIGLTLGLAVLCRPTEILMMFIPLLWQANDKEQWIKKREFLFKKKQFILTAIGFLAMVSIQLFYWKHVSDQWVFNVGSKWDFFNPHFRVLFGFEKGWFIYTPITIFLIIGLFFLKKKDFGWSVLIFCVLNIWVIIAWHDWQYGGSYSTRALVQSYPVFALAFASFISFALKQKWKSIFIIFGFYCCAVNLFQIYQYNQVILHYNDMNFERYKNIYLNPNATKI